MSSSSVQNWDNIIQKIRCKDNQGVGRVVAVDGDSFTVNTQSGFF